MGTFVHHELNTSDPTAAKKFYNGLFGWTFQDMKMPDGSVYSMFTTGDNEGGGIQKHPMPGAPNAWLQYVGVASVKQAMAKAAKLGAKVIVDFMPVPGHGAFGVFADPTGATCAVWEPSARPATKKAVKKKVAKKTAKKPAARKTAKKRPAKRAVKKKTR
ncbi:MAG: VOC family protein [Myxococcales bacterium]|nr:VOC family protein [Myxococcales bacterium]